MMNTTLRMEMTQSMTHGSLSRPTKAYIAGPMRGLPEYNFPAFHAAAADLRERGYEVDNPAEHDEGRGFDPKTGEGEKSFREYMAHDLPLICAADVVVVLPGWRGSEGASLEVAVAKSLGIEVLSYPSLHCADLSVRTAEDIKSTSRHPVSQRFHEILRELGETHDRKSADYGKEGDPLANVRASEEWGIPAWVGAMVRGTDKVRRLQTQATRGSLANESAVDAFMDLAVYAIIALVLFEELAAKGVTE